MIISLAPMRVSLFGGGSDYPAYFERQPGAVIGFALNQYTRVTVRTMRPFLGFKHRLVYSKIEDVNCIAEIKHPAIRAVLKEHWGDDQEGLEITHMGDLPAMSGMGSSSSFVVALLNAIFRLNEAHISLQELANEAIRIEQKVIPESVGCQDQIWAALGGARRIDFPCKEMWATQIISKEKIDKVLPYLMLCFTGLTRFANVIAGDTVKHMDSNQDRISEMVKQVREAQDIIEDGTDPRFIGVMLDRTWKLKRELVCDVTNPTIDAMYAEALAAGAIGGKLLGAGNGGFLLLFVEPKNQDKVRSALSKNIFVPVEVDYTGARTVS